MIAGDSEGRDSSTPYPPTITKDFDWSETEHKLLFEMTAKYGTPLFSNYVNSGHGASDVRSMFAVCDLTFVSSEKNQEGFR